ncbi:response regulator [Chitinophaga sancti]|uniref:DNA-binding response regulator, NarL/FixJ family, contains REC and HTH domains n=1 Tax=Chitinophaga sancti TaxID=1004 RepID=A0A1K1PK32_9BACT|nr:response regulator transcription factor [Chitinophaga sancti]WQD59487.1 response regulator transcription factor [Chitinophaga sancti]WQG88379.1 response regulator transcription factor [Chitinophaga sancti]SFW48128.1 DNA-binding response regulator, NarL/FixJ family, contains REC and HTH domains [Chitinophaga sancti]
MNTKINKVLIAEDHESMNISVQKTLEEMGILQPDYVYYCDDALVRVQNAITHHQSYDLLITDLYFEEDSRPQKLSGGMALISAARLIQPDIRILVFSAENNPSKIEILFKEFKIDGYVRKARNDAKELKSAIESIAQNQTYFPRHLMQVVKQKNAHDFTQYDITIISLLAQGIRQNQIPEYLQQYQIKPYGLSSIEKRLKDIKDILGFSKNEQLVAYCKDIGVI